MKGRPQLTNKALSRWTKLNSDIKISYTKKKFFNEFYYRLTYLVPGGRIVTYDADPISIERRVRELNDNIQERWFYRFYKNQSANIEQIKDFARIYQYKNLLNGKKIKFRIENSSFNIYCECIDELYNLAATELAAWQHSIISISVVEKEKDFDLLDQGHIIVSKPQTHPHRVKIRETFGFFSERKSLVGYIKNLDDQQVKISKYILERLESEHKYFPGGYVRVSDNRVIDMIRLVAPNLVGSVTYLTTQ